MTALRAIQKARSLLAYREKLRSEKKAIQRACRIETPKTLADYYDDPVGFIRDVLGVKLWKRQVEIAEAIRDCKRVTVRSGHKCGKSTVLVCIALWFAMTRDRARVVMTSATDRQVRAILWKELRRVYNGALRTLGGSLALDPATGLQWPDGREILGFTAKDPEKMAGISGPNVLFILDEASGISQGIFEAIEGNRAGGALLIMCSNPTQTSGEFFDSFHSKRRFYRCIAMSSEETPNVTGEGEPIPGLATREWVDEKRAEWGAKSVLYGVRVTGDFPTQGSNAVVALGLVEAAHMRFAENDTEEDDTTEVVDIGVDVARFGDDATCIAVRRGRRLYEILSFHGLDSVQVAGQVHEVIRRYSVEGIGRFRVKVDTIGVGSGVVDALNYAPEPHAYEVIPINVAEKADDEGDFKNLRSQLWFGLTKWLEGDAILPPNTDTLDSELVSVKYKFDERGRRFVESKDVIKSELGRSPDHADALALAVYEGASMPILLPKYRPASRWGSGYSRGF